MALHISETEFNDQVIRTVQAYLRHQNPGVGRPGNHGEYDVRRHQGSAIDGIPAATNALTAPGTGTVRVIKKASGASSNMTYTNLCITAVNRFVNVGIEAGSLVKIEFLDGEWSVYAADCMDSNLTQTGCS